MSLVSPPERSVPAVDVIQAKNDDSSDTISPKINKATVLIAAVEESEPIVTRRELWSYYRAAFPPKPRVPFAY